MMKYNECYMSENSIEFKEGKSILSFQNCSK